MATGVKKMPPLGPEVGFGLFFRVKQWFFLGTLF